MKQALFKRSGLVSIFFPILFTVVRIRCLSTHIHTPIDSYSSSYLFFASSFVHLTIFLYGYRFFAIKRNGTLDGTCLRFMNWIFIILNMVKNCRRGRHRLVCDLWKIKKILDRSVTDVIKEYCPDIIDLIWPVGFH